MTILAIKKKNVQQIPLGLRGLYLNAYYSFTQNASSITKSNDNGTAPIGFEPYGYNCPPTVGGRIRSVLDVVPKWQKPFCNRPINIPSVKEITEVSPGLGISSMPAV